MGVSVEGMWKEAAHPGDTEIQSPPAQSEAELTLLRGSLLRGHRMSFLAQAVQGEGSWGHLASTWTNREILSSSGLCSNSGGFLF